VAELKTRKNAASIHKFLENVEHPTRRQNSFEILEMMREITGDQGSMWGDSIVGFGDFSYTNTTNKEFKWFKTGFSPRKQSLTLYIMDGFDSYDEILSRLGKYKTGKSCLYINKLADVDLDVLRELIDASVKFMESRSTAF
jgi:hypothetical protein